MQIFLHAKSIVAIPEKMTAIYSQLEEACLANWTKCNKDKSAKK